MFVSRKLKIIFIFIAALQTAAAASLAPTAADELGWVDSSENDCGGYYLDAPFTYLSETNNNRLIKITSNQTLLTKSGTSILEGGVTINREEQQITTNKAFLYMNSQTGKLSTIEMIGDVHLREPNTLVISKRGKYFSDSKAKYLSDVLYRTSLLDKKNSTLKLSPGTLTQPRKLIGLTAWGGADALSQTEPRIYELSRASFSTCPPRHTMWKVKASHIVLNKNTGRGYATNARLLVKEVPVFYLPYFSFSIDKQRKSGFLWPTIGIVSNSWGPYILMPFYWNMAPNYDMTITPSLLTKRGVWVSDNFRYLTEDSSGHINVSALPDDRFFSDFQTATKENPLYADSTNNTTQAEFTRLMNDSTTRKSLIWQNDSQYNTHWSSRIDYNYVGDDYYLRDFGSNISDITQNQLLQFAELDYKSQKACYKRTKHSTPLMNHSYKTNIVVFHSLF